MSNDVKQQNLKLLYEHYKDIDFDYWYKNADYAVKRINELKRDKNRFPYYLQLYTSYIQLLEIFATNVFALTEGDLFGNLFISNQELRKKIGSSFTAKNYNSNQGVQNFMDYYVFWKGIFGSIIVQGYDEKIKVYKSLLNESMKDYMADYDLLNAYKHGFRIKPTGNNSIYISPNDKPEQGFGMQFNAGVYYLVRKYDKETKTYVVSENSVSFNYERVFQKIVYLTNMLNNAKQAIIYSYKPPAKGKQIKVETFVVLDKKELSKYIGNFRWSKPLYEITKKGKSNEKVKN
jgi:hypothetical protein